MSGLNQIEAPSVGAWDDEDEWQKPGKVHCTTCRDTGTVLARLIRRPSSAPFAFNCGCETGERSRRRFPSWLTAERHKFEVVS